MYSRDEPFLRSLECYFDIYFPRCFATREINTKITLSWVLKRFVTRVHTLFSIIRLGCPRECALWRTTKETTNAKVLTLLIIDRFLPLKVHIPIFFSSENYYSDCIVIAKTFLDLAEGTIALILWQDVATDCVRQKTNKTPFEVTRKDQISHWANIPDDTAASQPVWYTEVVEM